MELISERKLFKIGEGGYAITLPKNWIKCNGLRAGDIVEVLADKNVIVRVKPKPEEKLI